MIVLIITPNPAASAPFTALIMYNFASFSANCFLTLFGNNCSTSSIGVTVFNKNVPPLRSPPIISYFVKYESFEQDTK